MAQNRITIRQSLVGSFTQWTVSVNGRCIANALNRYDALRIAIERASELGAATIAFE